MRVAVGLGNPGREYENSRHNLGFEVIDRVARAGGIERWANKFDGLFAQGRRGDAAYMLLKPQTYMNLSGRSVGALLRFYKIPVTDALVIVDDMDLPAGKVRLRIGGSDGGHRGLRSIIQETGERAFNRIRVGIGRPAAGQSVIAHVLSRTADEAEQKLLADALDIATERTLAFIEHGAFENWSTL